MIEYTCKDKKTSLQGRKTMEKEKIFEECLRRMKALKLHDEGKFSCVGSFKEDQKPWKSEFDGILYWLDEDEEQAVKEFEEKHQGYKVYHCIKSHTEFGELLSMLYVNGNDEEFEEDKENFDYDIADGYAFAYVKNLTDDWSSEFGSIGIQSINGGVQRVA